MHPRTIGQFEGSSVAPEGLVIVQPTRPPKTLVRPKNLELVLQGIGNNLLFALGTENKAIIPQGKGRLVKLCRVSEQMGQINELPHKHGGYEFGGKPGGSPSQPQKPGMGKYQRVPKPGHPEDDLRGQLKA